MNVESRILNELSKAEAVSGEAISAKLSLSRSAVWKHIGRMRQRGYQIEASPGRGYMLVRRPDRLLAEEIQPLLHSRIIGRRIIHFESTGSTADEARKLIAGKAPEGTVVIAEKQTRGRGRLGRSWQTPAAKAVAVSVILYPAMPPASVPVLSLGTALAVKNAVAKTVKSETGVLPPGLALKWPNDVYLNGKKLAGVLMEMAAEIDRVSWLIDSIGLNVNNSFFSNDLRPLATSLADEFHRSFDRRRLTAALLDDLDKIYDSAKRPRGLRSILSQFQQQDLLQGKRVTIKMPGGSVSGIASGIDGCGRLLVADAAGGIIPVSSGEATLSGSLRKRGRSAN